jgi:DNA-binding CsgD family transcriptional regulator
VLGAIGSDLVIERIYEAVSDPARWSTALEAVGDLLDADAILLVYGNHASGGLSVVEATGFSPQALGVYAENHLDEDELIRESTDGPAGIIVSSGRSCRGKPFFRTSVYRRLLQPSDLCHIAGAAALNTPEVHASLWMARTDGSPDFSIQEVHEFSNLLPHVTRAMTVHHRIRQAELQADMALGAFDRVAVGVVLLDARGVPVLVNREADRIARANDGFILIGDGMAAARSNESMKLRELIRRVCGQGQSRERPGGGAVRLTRPSGRLDYHVVMLPLPKRCQPGDGKGAVAVLFITDTERTQTPIDHIFGELYGLTDAEIRLVTQLLAGGGLTAAAERLGLSRNTVHSQLASVFQKTGTKSQSELLTLFLTSVAPVEAPHETSGFDLDAIKPRQKN